MLFSFDQEIGGVLEYLDAEAGSCGIGRLWILDIDHLICQLHGCHDIQHVGGVPNPLLV